MRSNIPAIVLLLFLASLAFSLKYTVGPSRTYTSLQSVTSLLNPGDTVEVDGNATYTGGVVFTRAGEAARKIVIRGIRAANKRPVLSGGTNTVHFMSSAPYVSGADHYVFEGFEVTGGTFRGIYHQSDDLTVRDVLVHDCAAHGILGGDQGSGSLLLEYSEVYGCGSGSSQHQIYMATDETHHPGSVFRMQFCYLHDAKGGNNVKSRSERNEIYYNWIEGAYYHELELIGPDPNNQMGPPDWTPELKREDSDVMGNVLRKKRTAAANDSNFSVTRVGGDGTGESKGRYRFVNNTVISGTGAVFRIFDGIESIEMHNNAFYSVTGGPNLKRVVEALWSTGAEVIAGSNNWVKQGASNTPSQWTGTMTGTDPGFTSPATLDFRPNTGSPLINAGNSVLAGPAGYAFPTPSFPPAFHPPFHAVQFTGNAESRTVSGTLDIGAFESSAGNFIIPALRTKTPDTRALSYTVYDIRGRRAANLSANELAKADWHALGRAGIYFAVANTKSGRVVKKIAVIK